LVVDEILGWCMAPSESLRRAGERASPAGGAGESVGPRSGCCGDSSQRPGARKRRILRPARRDSFEFPTIFRMAGRLSDAPARSPDVPLGRAAGRSADGNGWVKRGRGWLMRGRPDRSGRRGAGKQVVEAIMRLLDGHARGFLEGPPRPLSIERRTAARSAAIWSRTTRTSATVGSGSSTPSPSG
jgi:hypothetical protein